LYAIQQNKELSTQQAALQKQQKEIDALKEIITKLASKK
jgi:hypothetical protein